jgi:hypothetical protein
VTELEQRQGPPKTSRNSSVPPSKSERSNPPLVLRCERTKRGPIEQACDRLLAQTLHTPRAEKLQARYRKHREHLFVFLHQANVPPDNNASERALRNSVVHRKVTGGFRSAWGAKLHAAAMTVMETAKKRKQNVLGVLRALFAPLPKPIPASQSP